MNNKNDEKKILEDFEFRTIKIDEVEQAVLIEQICFPPNEACSPEAIRERIKKAQELFFVAVDKKTNKIAGFLNGLSTDEESFRDDFFVNPNLYSSYGKNIMLLGLDVLPDYRGRGIARELINQYIKRESKKGRKKLILTCLESKVSMYKNMGFQDMGMSCSTWGNEKWHEMKCEI